MVGPLGQPSPERGAEAVRNAVDAAAFEQPTQPLDLQRPTPPAWKHQGGRRRAPRPRRGPPAPGRTAAPGARASSSFSWPRWVHTRLAVSISSHVAIRTSTERAAVSTRNSNASLTTGLSPEAPTATERRGDLTVRQRPHVRHDVALRAKDWAHAVTRVVIAQIHRNGPLQHGVDPLPDVPGDGGLSVPDGREGSPALRRW